MIRMGLTRTLVAYVMLAGLLAAGCGIRFRDQPLQSELLVSLSQTEAAEPGRVRMQLTYRRFYPVPVALTCSLLRSDGREAIPSLRITIGPSDVAATPSTAASDAIDVVFTNVPTGKYVARCATDKAADAISTEVSA